MIRNCLYFVLSITLLFGVLAIGSSVASAAEVQLAGVRLDSPIVDLLTNPAWGEPDGIGPVSGSGGGAGAASSGSTSARAGTPRRAAGGGGRAAASRSGGGRGPGAGASRAGGAGRGPGAARRTGGAARRTGGARSTGGGGGTGQTAASGSGKMSATTGMQYWRYNKASGTEVILGVEPSGAIALINVSGTSDFTIYTSRGIGLGDTFSDLVNTYGYPDRTDTSAQGMVIFYPEHNVRFTLGNLRITQIMIGAIPARAAGGSTARQRASTPAARRGPGAAGQRRGQSSGGFRGPRRGMSGGRRGR